MIEDRSKRSSCIKICMLANHCCVRVDKMAMPLIERGNDVHVISHKKPVHWPYYKSRAMWEDLGQLIEAVRIYAKEVDIFHAHNEPSYFVTIVKEITDKPVILDVHDSFLARATPDEVVGKLDAGQYAVRILTEERNNFQLADGLVFPSAPFGDLICKEFKLTQPRLNLPSYCTKKMQVYSGEEWLGGLVYEGRVDLKSEIDKHPQGAGFRYCDYEQFAEKAHALGIDFHLYARNDDPFTKIYEPIAFPHVPKPLDKLLRNLSRHDWGLVGNLNHTPEWEVAFPNKMFEYIAAGTPVVAINAAECSRFLETSGLGITVGSLEELCARWSEHTEIRKHLLRTRQKWIMEAHIQGLEAIYREVLNG